MKLFVEDIPNDKFWDIQNKILRVLVENGFKNVETITVQNVSREEILGVSLKINE